MNKQVFNTTRIITQPGAEYSDQTRQFQGIPGIERAANGRLWATWYGGGSTEDRHNYVMLATSPDEGGQWSGVKLIVDPDGPGPLRAFDPVLWHDPTGRLWLFWNQKLCNLQKEFTEEEERTWYLWAIHTDDSGSENPKWSEPRRICEAIMMNKPTVLSTGPWLLCSSDWFWDWSARLFRSLDSGQNWSHWGRAHVSPKTERSFDEHMIVEKKDGSLWMLVRTKYGIGESFSHDSGRTWSFVTPSAIAHTSTRFFIRRLISGNLILVKHGVKIDEITTSRSHLTAYVSRDDGQTWEGGLLLDERPGVSYPDGVQAPDGGIHIIYDYHRKLEKQILHVHFTEQDILDRKWPGGEPRRHIVNQALGTNTAITQ